MNNNASMFPWEFHHLGVACRNIEKDCAVWFDLGYQQEGEVFIDEFQGIRGMFINGAGPRLELLENLPNRTMITPWLEKGVKTYHTAFEVEDMENDIGKLVDQRAKILVNPVPAAAFENRQICFLMLRNLMLIELIENKRK